MNPGDHQEGVARALAIPSLFDEKAEEILRLAKGDRWVEAMKIANEHALVFDTPAGQALLHRWVKTFLTSPIVRAGDDQFSAGIREGRADVIRQILANLHIAHTSPEQPQ